MWKEALNPIGHHFINGCDDLLVQVALLTAETGFTMIALDFGSFVVAFCEEHEVLGLDALKVWVIDQIELTYGRDRNRGQALTRFLDFFVDFAISFSIDFCPETDRYQYRKFLVMLN